jgi:hypothetical protein
MLSAVLADLVNRIAIGDLKRNKPEPIVAIETVSLTPGRPVPRWLEENLPAVSRTSSFLVMVRKGGELDRKYPIAAN